jgi:hypothetical protein
MVIIGSMKPLNEDIVGKVFSRLTVLKAAYRKDRFIYYICHCECGTDKYIRRDSLLKGKIKSCGCKQRLERQNNIENIIGKRFGKLIVIKHIGLTKQRGNIFLCKCDCGNTRKTNLGELNRGNATHCGCENFIEMTGQKIGKLTVIKKANKENITEIYWLCQCECGNTKITRGSRLRKGEPKSCGCTSGDQTAEKNRKYDPKIASAKSVFKRYKDGNLTFDNFLELSSQPCYYCGIAPQNTYNVFSENRASKSSIENGDFIYNGLDRVDPTKPHNLDNVVPCCRQSNVGKFDYTQQQYKDHIVRSYNHIITTGQISQVEPELESIVEYTVLSKEVRN